MLNSLLIVAFFKGTLLKDTATKDPIAQFCCVEHVVFVEAWLLKQTSSKEYNQSIDVSNMRWNIHPRASLKKHIIREHDKNIESCKCNESVRGKHLVYNISWKKVIFQRKFMFKFHLNSIIFSEGQNSNSYFTKA